MYQFIERKYSKWYAKKVIKDNIYTGWHTGVGRFSKKKYSVDFQREMDLFVQK